MRSQTRKKKTSLRRLRLLRLILTIMYSAMTMRIRTRIKTKMKIAKKKRTILSKKRKSHRTRTIAKSGGKKNKREGRI